MKYIFLTEDFYNDYKSCKEIEKKLNRPYIQVCIEIGEKVFAIPLRSHIKHPNVLWTDKDNQCGLDFSKAVLLIHPEKYIDNKNTPYIRPNEFEVLKDKEHIIKTKLVKYIKAYQKAKKKTHIEVNNLLCKYSTLQYFEEYILTMFKEEQ